MHRSHFTFCFLLFWEMAFAQPCNFPAAPSNTCGNAPLLCNLDGYCSSNAGATNTGTPNAFCGLVENNNWVSFIAGSTTFTLQITISNCNMGGGLQAQIFSTTNCQFFTAVSNCIDGGGNGTFTLNATNLTIGETYYLMMDGKGGDVCNYVYALLNGTTLSPAHADIQPDGLLCENGTLTLDAVAVSPNPNLTYLWSTQDGNILVGVQTPTIEICAPGTYSILIEDGGGCRDSAQITVPLNPVPQLAITTPDTLDCLTNTIVNIFASTANFTDLFSWTTSNGSIAGGQASNNPLVDQPGTYVVVAMDALTGCSSTDSVQVFADQETPFATATGGGELNCRIASLTLSGIGSSAGPNFTYLWTTNTGHINFGETTLTPQVDAPGIYTLLVTSLANGCTATASATVTLNDAKPTGADMTVRPPCYAKPTGNLTVDAVIGGTAPYLYAIDGQGFATDNEFAGLPVGTYRIAIRDATGCEWDTLIPLFEQPQLLVELGADLTLPLGCDTTLRALVNTFPDNIDSIIWTPHFDCPRCPEMAVLPLENTTYQVKVIDRNGCTATDKVTVFLNKKRNVFIPNAFSPNDDGINDLFFVNAGKDVAQVLDFKVFDRWGNLVASFQNFPPNDLQYVWNGSFRGRPASLGVYAYFARMLFLDGAVEVYEGDVVLVR